MLDLATKIAQANPIEGLPRMSAILVDSRGKVVSVGLNRRKSHPLQKSYAKDEHCIYLHAEVDALRKVIRTHPRDEIANMSIFIARVNKSDLSCMAKPCTGCQRALKDFGIKKVYWTEDKEIKE